MKKIYLEIVLPKSTVFQGDVQKVTLPTTEGPVEILPGHIKYFAVLDKGLLKFSFDGKESKMRCNGGCAFVESNKVKISAIELEPIEETTRR